MPPVAFVPATLSLDDLQTIVEIETHKREILRQQCEEFDRLCDISSNIDFIEKIREKTRLLMQHQRRCSTKIYKANKEILWREMMEFRANMRLRAQTNL